MSLAFVVWFVCSFITFCLDAHAAAVWCMCICFAFCLYWEHNTCFTVWSVCSFIVFCLGVHATHYTLVMWQVKYYDFEQMVFERDAG